MYNIGTNLVETVEICKDNTYTTFFEAKGNWLKKVDIFFSTNNKKLNGNTVISIIDDEECIYKTVINNEDIVDNEFYTILCDDFKVQSGEKYKLEISSDNKTDGVLIWLDNESKLVSSLCFNTVYSLLNIIIINLFFFIFNFILCVELRFLVI